MTDKITDRLRVTEVKGKKLPFHDLRYEAADEIERLWARLAELEQGNAKLETKVADYLMRWTELAIKTSKEIR